MTTPTTEPNLREEIERLELLGIPLNKITGSNTLIDELLSLISHYTDRQVIEARLEERMSMKTMLVKPILEQDAREKELTAQRASLAREEGE